MPKIFSLLLVCCYSILYERSLSQRSLCLVRCWRGWMLPQSLERGVSISDTSVYRYTCLFSIRFFVYFFFQSKKMFRCIEFSMYMCREYGLAVLLYLQWLLYNSDSAKVAGWLWSCLLLRFSVYCSRMHLNLFASHFFWRTAGDDFIHIHVMLHSYLMFHYFPHFFSVLFRCCRWRRQHILWSHAFLEEFSSSLDIPLSSRQ